MNNGERTLSSEIKNNYLNKKNKKKHRKIRFSATNLITKDLEIKEKPKKFHLFKFPTSLNVLSYKTENNDNYITDNSCNFNFPHFPKNLVKKQTTKFMRNLVTEKILYGPTDKYKINNNLNNIYANKLSQSANKIITSNNTSTFKIYDYNSNNNSVFISHRRPINVKSFLGYSPDKEIFQKIVSLDIFGRANSENNVKNKKISNINYSYFPEKTQNINDIFNKKAALKKRKRYYPSVKMFDINTERLDLIEEKSKIFDYEHYELKKKFKNNFSSDNRSNDDNKNIKYINSYNYKRINKINSICKPTIINSFVIKNKNESNNFSNNYFSVRGFENIKERNLIKPTYKKRFSTFLGHDDCQKLKIKLLKKFSSNKNTNKNDYTSEIKKSSLTVGNNDDDKIDFRKKAIASLKNNIQFFNKLTGNKKLNDENKHKISLFPSSNYLLKVEQIKEEEKVSDINSENKENNTDDSENNSDDSCSIKEKASSDFLSDDESKSTIKKNKKSLTISGSDNSDKNNKIKKIYNNLSNEYSSEKSEESKNSIEELKKKKLKKFAKYDDENLFYKKRILKIKSKLRKISKESYVLNTRKKEIKNNFMENNIIENITKKMMETYGLKFLDEDKADEIIQQKFKIDNKNRLSKEILKKSTNNIHLFHMLKIFKMLYTQKISIKYNFNLCRVQEILNMYETHLLKLTDKVWNKINSPYDYSMEIINYICHKKDITNNKFKNSDKLTINSFLVNQEKNDVYLKEKKLKKKILKADQYFFKELVKIKKELHFKTAYLHLKINLIDFQLHDNPIRLKNETNLNNIFNKEIKLENERYNESNKSNTLPPKKVNSLKTIINLKNNSVINLQSKKKMSLSRANSLTKKNLELSNKLESPKNYLFRSSRYLSKDKITENMEKEGKYKKYIEEKEKKLKKTEKKIIGLNILKNKNLFSKDYIEKSFNAEKKISEIFKSKNKLGNFDRNNKTDAVIIKSCGYDLLSIEAALIKTQEMENDLPNVKLFEKFVMLIKERNFDLFEKYVNLEEDKFLKIINRRDLSSGNTLLYFAVENKLINFMKILLIKGANPNIQNNFGNSPLHLAYKFNSFFIVNLLLEYNANKQLKNSEGLFPGQMSKFVNG